MVQLRNHDVENGIERGRTDCIIYCILWFIDWFSGSTTA